MRGRSIATAVAGIALALPVFAHAAPYPPVDQKRPPLLLKMDGIFWAGGQIVNRTQSGSANAGDLKNIPFTQQQVLTGQAYVWGNDHIMMWDTNSDEIAGLLLKWIEQHVERRR